MYIGNLNITDYKETWNPDEIRIKCVFCGEQKYKLYLNLKHKIFHCFRCGKSGRFDLNNFHITTHKRIQPYIKFPEIQDIPNNIKQYLYKRRVDNEIIREKNIYYDKQHNALVFPIRNDEGEYTGYISRLFNNEEIKYFKPQGWDRGSLYNIELAKEYEWVIITEGVFDVLPHYKEYPVVALFGKFVNEKQYKILKQHFKHIIIALDGDVERKHIENLTIRLLKDFSVDILQLPENTDLNDINLHNYLKYDEYLFKAKDFLLPTTTF